MGVKGSDTAKDGGSRQSHANDPSSKRQTLSFRNGTSQSESFGRLATSTKSHGQIMRQKAEQKFRDSAEELRKLILGQQVDAVTYERNSTVAYTMEDIVDMAESIQSVIADCEPRDTVGRREPWNETLKWWLRTSSSCLASAADTAKVCSSSMDPINIYTRLSFRSHTT
jgi:hypothetical protein